MDIASVEEIYQHNTEIRQNTFRILEMLTEEQAAGRIAGQKWSLAAIVEHIAIVEESTVKVCARLLKKAEADNDLADGLVHISDNFRSKARDIHEEKLEAPQFVQPKGDQTVAQSLERMRQTASRVDELKSLFAEYDSSTRKFPHPYFGEISAQEWLLVTGLHEKRHTDQLKRLLSEQTKKPGCEEGMQPGNESKQ